MADDSLYDDTLVALLEAIKKGAEHYVEGIQNQRAAPAVLNSIAGSVKDLAIAYDAVSPGPSPGTWRPAGS